MLDQVGFQDFLKTAEISSRSRRSFRAPGVYGTAGHWWSPPGGAGHIWCGCRFVSSCTLLIAWHAKHAYYGLHSLTWDYFFLVQQRQAGREGTKLNGAVETIK